MAVTTWPEMDVLENSQPEPEPVLPGRTIRQTDRQIVFTSTGPAWPIGSDANQVEMMWYDPGGNLGHTDFLEPKIKVVKTIHHTT